MILNLADIQVMLHIQSDTEKSQSIIIRQETIVMILGLLIMGLIHIMMIPIAYLLEIFPFLKPIAETSMEFILNLSEWIQG